MHQASAPVSDKLKKVPDVPPHQDRAYEFVECPMRAANGAKPTMSDINPANMVIYPLEIGYLIPRSLDVVSFPILPFSLIYLLFSVDATT